MGGISGPLAFSTSSKHPVSAGARRDRGGWGEGDLVKYKPFNRKGVMSLEKTGIDAF